ncbi:unnamed protein product [Protopolystoma xenopodis]|uniref:Uncharacterized protein n=1 Tax=Protopolystoma xenopodis TaxID=117903 RepID=A0A3S5CUW0_9PLAT|nr:unnamed protein product [Protopolystoma xenopodis]
MVPPDLGTPASQPESHVYAQPRNDSLCNRPGGRRDLRFAPDVSSQVAAIELDSFLAGLESGLSKPASPLRAPTAQARISLVLLTEAWPHATGLEHLLAY